MIVAFGALGLAVGSFLNLCIDRLPKGQSIVHPPSHCATCERRLAILDIVPVLSYIRLGGRCRYCDASIPKRLPAVELLTGVWFAVLYAVFGLTLDLLVYLTYSSLLVIIFFVDLKHFIIPNQVVYAGIAIALASSFFWQELEPVSALQGGALGLAALGVPFIIYRRGIGMGDVKLAALVGLMVSSPLVLSPGAGLSGRRGGGRLPAHLRAQEPQGRHPVRPLSCDISHRHPVLGTGDLAVIFRVAVIGVRI